MFEKQPLNLHLLKCYTLISEIIWHFRDQTFDALGFIAYNLITFTWYTRPTANLRKQDRVYLQVR